MKADKIIKLSRGYVERCLFKFSNHFMYDFPEMEGKLSEGSPEYLLAS